MRGTGWSQCHPDKRACVPTVKLYCQMFFIAPSPLIAMDRFLSFSEQFANYPRSQRDLGANEKPTPNGQYLTTRRYVQRHQSNGSQASRSSKLLLKLDQCRAIGAHNATATMRPAAKILAVPNPKTPTAIATHLIVPTSKDFAATQSHLFMIEKPKTRSAVSDERSVKHAGKRRANPRTDAHLRPRDHKGLT